MAQFFKNLFKAGVEDEGFIDYGKDDYDYDASSSAVTNEEADYGYDDSEFSGYKSSSKILNMHSTDAPKLYVMKPSSYDEVMNGAVDMLREGTIIFLNLNGIDKEVGTRIVDFMSGVAAAFEGRIKKVDTCCYAVAPKNVEWIPTIGD
ncbi:MAG: cell division protein SepF [Oscillospiraceae bacterium]|nr:cell division protein SepF [Oscillospiraceae bacterium]